MSRLKQSNRGRAEQGSIGVVRRPRQHYHVSRIRYSPVGSDDLSRRFVALFDMLGVSDELFDNRPEGNRIKQRP